MSPKQRDVATGGNQHKHMRSFLLFFFVVISLSAAAQQHAGRAVGKTFTNPILPSGADPWCMQKDGYYYYTNTTQTSITLWKTKSIGDMINAERKVVFVPPDTGMYSHELWAPEIHYLNNKWYIYFAADDGSNVNHRLWVLENASADPMEGEWIMKGKLTTPEDKWSIDPTVYDDAGQLYLLWSGWKGDVNGQQNIYIAKMKDPCTVEGKRVMISEPQWSWETVGDLKDKSEVPHVNVNEAPQVLRKDNRIFVIYSASGCWTESYNLGMLYADARSDLMNPESWTKSSKPVFSKNMFGAVFAPGHNAFFKSPDGKEDWILYHASDKPKLGCGDYRSPRAQPFSWKSNGMPDFGKPVRRDKRMNIPAEKQVLD